MAIQIGLFYKEKLPFAREGSTNLVQTFVLTKGNR
jgi:hypothetical protein